MNKNRISQAEHREVMRSQLRYASYNPRFITEEARKSLKANLKRVGLLGGIVWNEDTGNLVSGHQKMDIMDEANKYDPDNPETDYPIVVEVTHLSEKEEKEQNLFMNNKAVQGDFDNNLLREMFSDDSSLDFSLAGFNELDMQFLGLVSSEDDESDEIDRNWSMKNFEGDSDAEEINDFTKNSEENRNIKRDTDFYKADKEEQIARHNEIQKIKDRINRGATNDNDGGMFSYLVVKFSVQAQREHLLSILGYDDLTLQQINGDDLLEKLEFGG